MTLSELFYITAGLVVCLGLKAWVRHGIRNGHYSTRKNLLIFTPLFLLLILVFLFTQQFA